MPWQPEWQLCSSRSPDIRFCACEHDMERLGSFMPPGDWRVDRAVFFKVTRLAIWKWFRQTTGVYIAEKCTGKIWSSSLAFCVVCSFLFSSFAVPLEMNHGKLFWPAASSCAAIRTVQHYFLLHHSMQGSCFARQKKVRCHSCSLATASVNHEISRRRPSSAMRGPAIHQRIGRIRSSSSP